MKPGTILRTPDKKDRILPAKEEKRTIIKNKNFDLGPSGSWIFGTYHVHPATTLPAPSSPDLVTIWLNRDHGLIAFVVSADAVYLLVHPGRDAKKKPNGRPYSNVDIARAYAEAVKNAKGTPNERLKAGILAVCKLVGIKAFKGVRKQGEKSLPSTLEPLGGKK